MKTLYQYPIGNNQSTFAIPNSVTTIGESAFFDCTSLTSITIPESVTTIGAYAFDGCDSLESITIPNSVTTIDRWAFSYCTSLTSITFEGTKAQWNAITKASSWKSYTPATYVQCSDGQVPLS